MRKSLLPVLLLLGATTFSGCGVNEREMRDSPASVSETTVASFLDRVKSVDAGSKASTFEQEIDHAGTMPGTFKQRFFVNSTFARGPDAPVLLYLCGEWECSSREMVRVLLEKSDALGAHMVAFEHRFYGQSQPFGRPSFDLGELRFLGIREALEDFSRMQDFVAREKGISGRWFVEGCSYAGSLAAYYRSNYPTKVAGAHACSAPVRSTPSGFHTYDSWAAELVGTECAANVRRVTGLIHGLARSDNGLAKVSEVLSLPFVVETPADVDALLVMVLPQFAQRGKTAALCEAVKPLDDELGSAKALIAAMTGLLGARYWAEGPLGVLEEAVPGDDSRSVELWFFQTCREAGWHYVTSQNGASSLFDFTLGIDYYATACRRSFGDGIDALVTPFVTDQEARLLKDASNILFTNGSQDPWTDLSFGAQPASDRNVVSLVNEGGAHCTDMFKDMTSAPEETKRVKEFTLDFTSKALGRVLP